MKERPILFTGDEVRAILDGRKTQTRRPVKPQPFDDPKWGLSWAPRGVANNKPVYCERNANFNPITKAMLEVGAPLGTIGDRLWVRETWAPHCEMLYTAIYRCDRGGDYQDTVTENFRWTPSIHMPRWASRIDLEITAVRVERVQDITDFNAFQEGAKSEAGRITGPYCMSFKQGFYNLWQSIYANWDANPWVWVYEFRRIKL